MTVWINRSIGGSIADRLLFALLLLCISGVLYVVMQGIAFEFWRHDDWLYENLRQYRSKVRAEGRWINYLVLPLVQQIPAFIAWCTNYLILAGALYLLFRNLVTDWKIALILALIVSLFPGFMAQNLWPLTAMPATLAFLFSTIGVRRYGVWALPLSGVVLFGTLPYFYFLLPLAFYPSRSELSSHPLRCIVPGVVWIGCFALGYAVAASVNLVVFDRFGLDLQSWRDPQPVTDWASLQAASSRYASMLTYETGHWLPVWSLWVLGLACGLVTLERIVTQREMMSALMATAYGLVVAVIPFLAVLPSGIWITSRTLLSLAAGVLALPFLLAERRRHRTLAGIVVLAIGVPSLQSSIAGVRWFVEATHAYMRIIEPILPEVTKPGMPVVVDARDQAAFFEAVRIRGLIPDHRPWFLQGLESAERLVPALMELGYRRVTLCLPGLEPRPGGASVICAEHGLSGEAPSRCDSAARENLVCIIESDDAVLILRLNSPRQASMWVDPSSDSDL